MTNQSPISLFMKITTLKDLMIVLSLLQRVRTFTTSLDELAGRVQAAEAARSSWRGPGDARDARAQLDAVSRARAQLPPLRRLADELHAQAQQLARDKIQLPDHLLARLDDLNTR